MAVGHPSSSNTFVPSHEASGGLIIGFTRNVKRFKVNQYVKRVPVKKDTGYYLRITAEEAARVINSNLQDFLWHDGQEAPMGNENTESFEYHKYATRRYAFPFNLGQKAVEQADWQILQVHAGIAAQKAMTALTVSVATELTTAGNWTGSTDTATNLAGGQLNAATSALPYIKKLFQAVSENILKATLGVVQREDLVAVMNPYTAGQIAQSQEIIDHLKQSPFAFDMLKQNPNAFGNWGLPAELYGIKIVVEDAVKVTSKKGATRAVSYCYGNGNINFLARPGGILGVEGVPEFSTVQVFSFEEMSVETRHDPDNRRHQGRVVDDYVVETVAPASGYLVTAAVA